MNEITNEQLISNYLNIYRHSDQSVRMRKSSLNYFFGEKIEKKKGKKVIIIKLFHYNNHIFEINTIKLKEYFIWLKNLDTLSLATKKAKWAILKSFINSLMEDYPLFVVKIPKNGITWTGNITKNGKKISNSNIFATKDEIQAILNFLKKANFKHYLIIRLLVETGMRKGELINATISDLNLKEKYINPKKGKTGMKYYVFSDSLANLLSLYVEERKNIKTNNNSFFITKFLDKYSNRAFNLIIKNALKQLDINKNITTKTFRKSLNDFRKEMGCILEDRKLLLGHKLNEVNVENYTKTDLETLKKLYDKWNPYKDLDL